MSDHSKDAADERGAIREELGDDSQLADEEAIDEASFAPPGPSR